MFDCLAENLSQSSFVLQEVLEKCLTAERDYEFDDYSGIVRDSGLSGDIHSAIATIGKEKIYELEDLVAKYLDDKYWQYRMGSIKTLCSPSRLGLEKYLPKALEMAFNEDCEARETAIIYYGANFWQTDNVEAMKNLYKLATEPKYEDYCVTALEHLMHIFTDLDLPEDYFKNIRNLEDTTPTFEDYISKVDWSIVNECMAKHVPWFKPKYT